MSAAGNWASSGCSSVAKDEEQWASLEPFFFDEAMALVEHAAAEAAKELQRKKEEHEKKLIAHGKDVEDRITDFDPKQGGIYCTRICHVDLCTFDLDMESSLGPMRNTNRVRKPGERPYELCHSFNILPVKIASSDIGYPINVYGTVIARDSIDMRCIYLFRRDRDDCQRINSKDESLTLTGPKRGLALIEDAYVEIDLKIRSHGEQDKELSKGYIGIRGVIVRRWMDKCVVESECLATRLSTVEVMYGVVKAAVEATFAIEVVQGGYHGEITAWTSSIPNTIVLHDSMVAGARASDVARDIRLARPVVAVCVKEKLYVKIVAHAADGKIKHKTVVFVPKVNGGDKRAVYLGATELRVNVTWSVIGF